MQRLRRLRDVGFLSETGYSQHPYTAALSYIAARAMYSASLGARHSQIFFAESPFHLQPVFHAIRSVDGAAAAGRHSGEVLPCVMELGVKHSSLYQRDSSS